MQAAWNALVAAREAVSPQPASPPKTGKGAAAPRQAYALERQLETTKRELTAATPLLALRLHAETYETVFQMDWDLAQKGLKGWTDMIKNTKLSPEDHKYCNDSYATWLTAAWKHLHKSGTLPASAATMEKLPMQPFQYVGEGKAASLHLLGGMVGGDHFPGRAQAADCVATLVLRGTTWAPIHTTTRRVSHACCPHEPTNTPGAQSIHGAVCSHASLPPLWM